MEEKFNDITLRIKENLNLVQGAKTYKISLALKRLILQLLKGNQEEKKDFTNWLLSKTKLLNKNNNNIKGLISFDYLENVKIDLEKIEARTTSNTPFLKKKTTQQVFIFDDFSYSDSFGNSRASQLAKAFNEIGLDVYFIFTKERNRSIVEPVTLAMNLNNYSKKDIISMVRSNAIFIFFEINELHFPFIEFAKNNKIISFLDVNNNSNNKLNNRLSEEIDYLITDSYTNKVEVEKNYLHKVLNLNVAVDNSLFEPNLSYDKPADILNKDEIRKCIIIAGVINFDIDFNILKEIAMDNQNYNFYVLQEKCIDEIINEKNIYFIGEKYIKDMPRYLSYSDALLLPLKKVENAYKYLNIILQQIAMNKRIITNANLNHLPNVIQINDWNKFKDYITDESIIQRFNNEQFIFSNSWYERCNRILDKGQNEKKVFESISIIVLNRNNMNVIVRCIQSLIKYNTYNYEIIVVDNDSTDGSYEYLRNHFSNDIILVKNYKNGCSSGRNLGVENSTGEYLYFLDSDQWVIGERWLDSSLEIIEKNPGIGAVGWNAGWFYPGKLDCTIVDYLPNRGITPDILYRSDIGLLATSGMLMKRKLFDQIGGFDEYYDPTCFEDTDLSLNIRYAGYEIVYSPYAMIKHLPHQTTKSGSEWHKKLMKRNSEYCKKKWEKLDKGLFEYYY